MITSHKLHAASTRLSSKHFSPQIKVFEQRFAYGGLAMDAITGKSLQVGKILETGMAISRRLVMVSGAAVAAACTASAAAQPGRIFAHGVASGDPLTDRVVLWTRISGQQASARSIKVQWVIASDPELKREVRRGMATTNAGRDFTVKVDVTGLRAGQAYWYGFRCQGETSPVGRTRTAPRTGGAGTRIALVSCSNFPAGWFNVYQAIARRGDVDLVLHVGDYIYEYGAGQYATQWGQTVGRIPEPTHECLTLADYRARHAQYKTDKDLQAAHACAPWLVTWDDHETSNDASKDGAQNHSATTEGPWSARKEAALKAYYEWMPLRDPAPGKPFDAINRSFEWGDIATIAMLETRLLARATPLEWETDLTFAPFDLSSGQMVRLTDPARLAGLDPRNPPPGIAMLPDIETFRKTKMADPSRQMLGTAQEAWLKTVLSASVARGAKWQVLGNQVIMARVTCPDLTKGIPEPVRNSIIAAQPQARALFDLSRFNVPFNLDAWDGYPAARDRLFALAEDAKARLVVCTGDTHAAWANRLIDGKGQTRGVEFGCTSVTSPSVTDTLAGTGLDAPAFENAITQLNDEVEWHNGTQRGYTLLTLDQDAVKADFFAVDTIASQTFIVTSQTSWQFDGQALARSAARSGS
jgi:alkaline phosphatase D